MGCRTCCLPLRQSWGNGRDRERGRGLITATAPPTVQQTSRGGWPDFGMSYARILDFSTSLVVLLCIFIYMCYSTPNFNLIFAKVYMSQFLCMLNFRRNTTNTLFLTRRNTQRDWEPKASNSTQWKCMLRASSAMLPKSDYLLLCLGSHPFLYYPYFTLNSSITT